MISGDAFGVKDSSLEAAIAGNLALTRLPFLLCFLKLGWAHVQLQGIAATEKQAGAPAKSNRTGFATMTIGRDERTAAMGLDDLFADLPQPFGGL